MEKDEIPGYDIKGYLGKGAFGMALLLSSPEDGAKAVAKKVPIQTQEDQHFAVEEALILRGMDSPYIVRYTDFHIEIGF